MHDVSLLHQYTEIEGKNLLIVESLLYAIAKQVKFSKDSIERSSLTAYLCLSTAYLYFVPHRGLADFILLLFPPLVCFSSRWFSTKNRLILIIASFIVLLVASKSDEVSRLRYWCYGEYLEKISSGQLPMSGETNFFSNEYKLSCTHQYQDALFSLILPIIGVGIIAGIVMLIWRRKNPKKTPPD